VISYSRWIHNIDHNFLVKFPLFINHHRKSFDKYKNLSPITSFHKGWGGAERGGEADRVAQGERGRSRWSCTGRNERSKFRFREKLKHAFDFAKNKQQSTLKQRELGGAKREGRGGSEKVSMSVNATEDERRRWERGEAARLEEERRPSVRSVALRDSVVASFFLEMKINRPQTSFYWKWKQTGERAPAKFKCMIVILLNFQIFNTTAQIYFWWQIILSDNFF
jgi:hypothetical protein